MYKPLETILPGRWHVSFLESQADKTGAGTYDFKPAGTFNAEVRDVFSGKAIWHGYWEVEQAQLRLYAHEVAPGCSSCIGGGYTAEWTIDLEQVQDHAFTGTMSQTDEQNTLLFQRD